tara:strand:+ start:358 stop:585 length:228 start_codon:yes stop_codon:yes gene_type:complete
MFGMGMPELLIILAIVLLLFGSKRLKNLGSDIGSTIKGFRKAVAEEDSSTTKNTIGEDNQDSEATYQTRKTEAED